MSSGLCNIFFFSNSNYVVGLCLILVWKKMFPVNPYTWEHPCPILSGKSEQTWLQPGKSLAFVVLSEFEWEQLRKKFY